MKKTSIILGVFLIFYCTSIKKEELIGKWDAVYSYSYNAATKETSTWLKPDISGGFTFDEKGWSLNFKREDGYNIKAGGVYSTKSNRVILKMYKQPSIMAILENDTLRLELKPSPPTYPHGILLKFCKSD